MKAWKGALGAVALALLGIMLTVSFKDAKANGATYLAAIGITRVPTFLQSAAAGLIFAIILTATLSVLITRWWMTRPTPTTTPTGPSDYDLYEAMDTLVGRMDEHLRYEGFSIREPDPNAILLDCTSFNLTLHKLGFGVPFLRRGTAREMFGVLTDFYTRIGPLLRDGHAQEARTIASEFAKLHPRRD